MMVYALLPVLGKFRIVIAASLRPARLENDCQANQGYRVRSCLNKQTKANIGLSSWNPEWYSPDNYNPICQALLLCPVYRWGKLKIKEFLTVPIYESATHAPFSAVDFTCHTSCFSNFLSWNMEQHSLKQANDVPKYSFEGLPGRATKVHPFFIVPQGVGKVGFKCRVRDVR